MTRVCIEAAALAGVLVGLTFAFEVLAALMGIL
jgi:hypothetical protein